MIQTHTLKAWPQYFDAVACGDKTFEGRKNDRGFQKGDLLQLVRHNGVLYQPDGPYGSELFFKITYILQGGQFGIEAGWCVLAIKPITKAEFELGNESE